jgi:hypothetical protein
MDLFSVVHDYAHEGLRLFHDRLEKGGEGADMCNLVTAAILVGMEIGTEHPDSVSLLNVIYEEMGVDRDEFKIGHSDLYARMKAEMALRN